MQSRRIGGWGDSPAKAIDPPVDRRKGSLRPCRRTLNRNHAISKDISGRPRATPLPRAELIAENALFQGTIASDEHSPSIKSFIGRSSVKKKLTSALLATAMIPMAAMAQDATTPPAETPPAGEMTPEPATPAPDAMTPPAGGMAPDAGMATDAPADAPEADAPEAGAMGTDAGMDAEPAESADAADSASEMEGPFVTVPPTGAWRVSDLEGKNVEDAAGESIGSISDTLVDENGEVIAVLVGVGGFLGIGAKDVAVAMSSLEFGPGSMEGLSTAPPADAAPAGGMTSTPAGGEAPAADAAVEPPVVGEDNLPDRIVLNVTREELEAAPAYGEDPADAAADSGGAMAPAGGGMAPAAPQ